MLKLVFFFFFLFFKWLWKCWRLWIWWKEIFNWIIYCEFFALYQKLEVNVCVIRGILHRVKLVVKISVYLIVRDRALNISEMGLSVLWSFYKKYFYRTIERLENEDEEFRGLIFSRSKRFFIKCIIHIFVLHKKFHQNRNFVIITTINLSLYRLLNK